jgi:mannose-6-phosphate isomerase-like protein (cupin superfamily)
VSGYAPRAREESVRPRRLRSASGRPLNFTVRRQFQLEDAMSPDTVTPIFGNVAGASKDTRGWFLGHFMPGDGNPLRTSQLELKWYTHAKGESRSEWAPGNPVTTLNILVRGHFVLLFPDREIALEKEGDFVLFGPGVPHSFRSVQESLVLTVRWPSLPPNNRSRGP